MFLFPAEGLFLTILNYGQLISFFLVFIAFEGVIAAKSKTAVPGLVFILLVFLLAVFVGISFKDFQFFLYMLIPVGLCFIAFYFSRRTRARNIAKGVEYNAEGLIEEELKKMQKGQ